MYREKGEENVSGVEQRALNCPKLVCSLSFSFLALPSYFVLKSYFENRNQTKKSIRSILWVGSKSPDPNQSPYPTKEKWLPL